jgi:hypothetical protein
LLQAYLRLLNLGSAVPLEEARTVVARGDGDPFVPISGRDESLLGKRDGDEPFVPISGRDESFEARADGDDSFVPISGLQPLKRVSLLSHDERGFKELE